MITNRGGGLHVARTRGLLSYAVCAALMFNAACSAPASSDGGTDGSPTGDAGACDSPPGACNPTSCATGNTLHIGAYCTKGGGQCDAYNLFCAIDLDPRGANFCLKLGCSNDSSCGPNACCYQGSACLPIDCGCPGPADAGPSDSGIDGGPSDAGGTDSGSDGGVVDGGTGD